ncbi:MAG: hypothetical protein PHH67_02640 [Methanosarcina sp.]|jgi:hypothetical protein|nr:hypothetical protein [Methanosarcina sp.]
MKNELKAIIKNEVKTLKNARNLLYPPREKIWSITGVTLII